MAINKHQVLPRRDEEARKFAYEYYTKAVLNQDSYTCLDEAMGALELISSQEWDERMKGDVMFLRFARDVARDLPIGLVEQAAEGAYRAIPDAIDLLAPGVYPVYRLVDDKELAPLIDDGIPMIFEVPT